jgi:Short C-terminal domain/Phospholipase_D-nuclease N-terminal
VLVLAYDYPLLGVFWTMFVLFIWIAWIFILVKVITDVFRSHDLGGGVKALWVLFIIFFPFLGTFVYLIARGKGMGERDMAIYQAQQEAFQAYVQDAAGSGGSTADELAKLADLKDRGVITQAEYDAQKAKVLS